MMIEQEVLALERMARDMASTKSGRQHGGIRLLVMTVLQELADAREESQLCTLLDTETLFGDAPTSEEKARAREQRRELAGRAKGRALVRCCMAFAAALRIAHGSSSLAEDTPPGMSVAEAQLVERMLASVL